MSPSPTSLPDEAEVLWRPPADVLATTRIGAYLAWLERERGLRFTDYAQLWEWSVTDLDAFWGSIWDHFGVQAASPAERVLGNADGSGRGMPGARWFPGSRVNYAAQALRPDGVDDTAVAVVAHSQSRGRVELTWGELRTEVARAAAGLRALGVGRGDRVAAYLPNIPETLVAFLATASLGAVWSSCAPEFGTRSVVDRFQQIEPAVLLAVDGYRYGGRAIDRAPEVADIRAALPSLTATVARAVPRARGAAPTRRARVVRPARARHAGPLARVGRLRPPALHPLLLGHDRAAQADRARPRRHHRRAPQGARPARRPRCRATASSGSPPRAG